MTPTTATQIKIFVKSFTKFLARRVFLTCPIHLRFATSEAGGEGGIRTPVPLARKAVFKTAAIDHSATSPIADWLAEPKLAITSSISSPPSFHFGAAALLSLRFERRLAGREGLEPPTNGFGDRYSTN